MAETTPRDAMQFLDLLLDFFDGGRRWTQGAYRDRDGGYCLIGAITHLRVEHRIGAADAVAALQDALPSKVHGNLMVFNDRYCTSFAEVRSLILNARIRVPSEARERAQREHAAENMKRWLLAEIERERTARAATRDERPAVVFRPPTPVPERLAA